MHHRNIFFFKKGSSIKSGSKENPNYLLKINLEISQDLLKDRQILDKINKTNFRNDKKKFLTNNIQDNNIKNNNSKNNKTGKKVAQNPNMMMKLNY